MKTLKDEMKKWVKVNPMTAKPKRKQKRKKRQAAKQPENLSERDLRYLMNANMQTLRRGKGGAYK